MLNDVSSSRSFATGFDTPPQVLDDTHATQSSPSASDHATTSTLPWNGQVAKLVTTPWSGNKGVSTPSAGPSFDAQVRGQDAKPIDLQLAELASDVYDNPGSPPAGWTRLSNDDLNKAGIDPNSLTDRTTGFQSALYKNDQGQVVLAYAGTDFTSGQDWLANGLQAAGLPAAQYSEAVTLATKAKQAFGDNLVITGHSLGGGLASLASAATDSAAVTFNASGVNDATLRRYVPDGDPSSIKKEADDGLIRRYAVKGDIVTGEQETGATSGLLPDAIGHKIELLPASHLPGILNFPGVNLIADTVNGVTLHKTDSVISALKHDQPWNPGAGPKEGIVDKISDKIGEGGGKIVEGIDAVKNGGKTIVGKIFDGAGSLLGHVPLVGGLLQGASHRLGVGLKGVIEVGGDLLDGIVGVGAHLLQGAEKTIGGAITSVVNASKWVGGKILDGAKGSFHFIGGVAKSVGHFAGSVGKSVGHFAGSVLSSAGHFASDIASKAAHIASKALPWNW